MIISCIHIVEVGKEFIIASHALSINFCYCPMDALYDNSAD